MLNFLKNLNPELKFYSIKDDEFKKYGRVLDFDSKEIIAACKKLDFPESGSAYVASVEALENLDCSDKLREMTMGGCEAQIGICHGYNTMMNGLEFHNCTEINVAVTPLVLLLGLRYEMEGDEYDSSNIKAFYLEEGDTVEVYGTSLHFCPCQICDSGFSSVVVLAKGTNTLLDKPFEDKVLFKRNKWIICHDKNTGLIEKGVYPGLHGTNYEIKYQEI